MIEKRIKLNLGLLKMIIRQSNVSLIKYSKTLVTNFVQLTKSIKMYKSYMLIFFSINTILLSKGKMQNFILINRQ